VIYRTFLDRKGTKRDIKGTKPDKIQTFWDKKLPKMSTGLNNELRIMNCEVVTLEVEAIARATRRGRFRLVGCG
jgi:hypothetical protein